MDFPSIGDVPFYFQPDLAALLELSQFARPLKVVKHDKKTDTFKLNEKNLASILERPDVVDSKVVIISVAGAFRTGKSFLLNFFLRYLECYEEKEEFLDGEITHLPGFSWRGGSERETDGIWLWSEPLFATTALGERVAILLMDTQGTFDSQSTKKECAAIFALSTLIASVQIYNLSQNIQEDNLEHLQLFTEYGKFAQNQMDTESAIFQTLIFLVRDWSCPYEYRYGFKGGESFLRHRLEKDASILFQISEGQHKELQQVRQHIQRTFSDLRCFLMPHPGLEIATKPHSKGQLPAINSDFKKHLGDFISGVLSEKHLAPKNINGKEITGHELLAYFRSYIKVFQGSDLPAVTSVFLATAEANHLVAFSKAKDEYLRKIRALLDPNEPSLTEKQISEQHQMHRKSAFEMFLGFKKMGSSEYTEEFLDKLKSEIEDAYENEFKVNNEIKRRSESVFYRFGRATLKTVKTVGSYISENKKEIAIVVGAVAAGIVLTPIVVIGAVIIAGVAR